MKYMTDEMIEGLAVILKSDGVDCRTVHEWIDGTKEKKRKIDDAEIRIFIRNRKSKGEDITLITTDGNSWRQLAADGLPVIFVQDVLREYVRSLRLNES